MSMIKYSLLYIINIYLPCYRKTETFSQYPDKGYMNSHEGFRSEISYNLCAVTLDILLFKLIKAIFKIILFVIYEYLNKSGFSKYQRMYTSNER